MTPIRVMPAQVSLIASMMGTSQSRWKNVRATRDSESGPGAIQVGMRSVKPSILAASDCTRYWFQSSPWNGEAMAAPAM